MARTTLAQLREDVYLAIAHYYKDTTPEKVILLLHKKYPPDKIDEWIRQGEEFVCREGRILYAEAHASISVKQYCIFLWNYCLDLLAVYWKEDGEDQKRLEPKTQKELDDEYGGDWEVSDDTEHINEPKFYVPREEQRGAGAGHSIKIYPRPENAGVIRIYMIRLPDSMTAEDDQTSLEGVWRKAVVDYVTYQTEGDARDIQELGMLLQSMKKEVDTRASDEDRVIKMEKIGGQSWRD